MTPRRLVQDLRIAAADVAELLALADPATTPEAVFEGLRAAHESLVGARRAAEEAVARRVDFGGC